MNNPIKNLRDYRFAHLNRRVTQEQLAEELGINQAKISRLERSDLDKMDFKYLQSLANYFEFSSIDDMLRWKPKELIAHNTPTHESDNVSLEDREIYKPARPVRNESVQIMVTLDGTERAIAKAIEVLNLNHRYLKSG